MPTDLSLTLSPVPSAGGIARVALREHFADGLRRSTFADLELVVSELVTNAVEHGRGAIRLEVTHTDREVRGFVSDRGIRLRLRAARLRRHRRTAGAGWRSSTPSSRTGASAAAARRSGSRSAFAERDQLVQAREVEDALDLRGRLHDHEPEALGRGAGVLVEEDRDAARGEERALGQVDDELFVAGLERGDRGDQVGRGRDVELALDRDGGDRPRREPPRSRTRAPRSVSVKSVAPGRRRYRGRRPSRRRRARRGRTAAAGPPQRAPSRPAPAAPR